MKTCTKCGELKELSEFYFNKKRDKYQTPCKECVKINMKIRRNTPTAKIKQAIYNNNHYNQHIERYTHRHKIWRTENNEYNVNWRNKQNELQILKYTPDDFKPLNQNDIPYHLYIVKHQEHPIFKIGVTKLIDSRIKRITNHFGDIKLIYKFTSDGTTCYKLERSLHIQFKKYNYKEFTKGDGRTEWFYEKCLNEVMSIFNTKQNLI